MVDGGWWMDSRQEQVVAPLDQPGPVQPPPDERPSAATSHRSQDRAAAPCKRVFRRSHRHYVREPTPDLPRIDVDRLFDLETFRAQVADPPAPDRPRAPDRERTPSQNRMARQGLELRAAHRLLRVRRMGP